MEIVFERETLFAEIWASPVITLAKRYNLSDNGLRKVCKAMEIPLPPRGYWQKLAAGQQPKIPKLAPTTGKTHFVSRTADIVPGEPSPADVELDADQIWLRDKITFERNPTNAVVVTPELHTPHRLVASTATSAQRIKSALQKARSEFERPKTRKPGELWQMPRRRDADLPSWGVFLYRGQTTSLGGPLPTTVGLDTIDRALRLWDALLQACESRGIKVKADGSLLLSGYATAIPLRLTERVERIIGPTKGLTSTQITLRENVKKQPSGQLRIWIGEGRDPKKVADEPKRTLESQLNSVLCAVYRLAVGNKIEAARAAERHRRSIIESEEIAVRQAEQRDLQRLRDEENQRRQMLIVEAGTWKQADTIRAYREHVMKALATSETELSDALQAWLSWADEVANELDPTKKRIG